jgi:L-asparagine oxygenase
MSITARPGLSRTEGSRPKLATSELSRADVRADSAPDAGPSVVRLDGAQAREVSDAARAVRAAAPAQVDDPGWVDAARAGWERLPAALRHRVREFRRDSGPAGALLIRGLPVDPGELPPTPAVEGSVQRAATAQAAMLTCVACGLGDPVAYASEKGGALVQDVVPVPGREDFQGNTGSVRLSFHTENAFHPHRPDFVMLLCLRSDHDGQAGLTVSCARTVLPQLSAAARQMLASASFVTAPPPSFGTGGAAVPGPVLTGSADDPDLRVDLAATQPQGRAAAAALDELAAAFRRAAHTIRLRPGDLAIVDNRVSVHGRTSYQPRYDGADRWLQRTFACADLRRSRAWRRGDGYVLAD